MCHHHVEHFEEKVKEQEKVKDTVFQLEQMLCDVKLLEENEAYLAKELDELEKKYEKVSFCTEMVFDSVGRAQKLVRYRHRLESIIQRLGVFVIGRQRPYLNEGGYTDYD
jgi:hypothetical protein